MAMVWRPSVVFRPCVFDWEGGCTYMLYTLMGGGGGQMSNTFFESGGKCPPLIIIRGADVLVYHFS